MNLPGNHETEATIQQLMNQPNLDFRRIFTLNKMYNIVVSHYDGVKTTKIISLRPEKFLNVIINEVEMAQVNKHIENIDREIHSLETKIGEDKVKIEKLTEKRKMKRNVKTTYQKREEAIELHKRRIESLEGQIEEVKKLITAVDDAKEVLAGKLDRLHMKQMKVMEEMSSIMKACVEHTSSEAVFVTKINFVRKIRSQCK